MHAATYGAEARATTPPPSVVRDRLHKAMWDLPRTQLSEDGHPDSKGRLYRISSWHLTCMRGRQIQVCRSGWKCAMGGSNNAHDDMYGFVLRGRSPVEQEASLQGQQQVRLLTLLDKTRLTRDSQRREYGIGFWVRIMRLCDWMPNDDWLVLRGPGYKFFHKEIYGPPAKHVGLFFEYKAFMKLIKPALKVIASELPECDAAKLSFGRSERHSKFPECSQCQQLREAYLSALANPSCSPEVKA